MRLLLDTHVILWWLVDDARLLRPERDVMAHPDAIVHVSAASVWEISIKQRLGRLTLEVDLLQQLEQNDFFELPIGWMHASTAGKLPRHHEDPVDRMLIAQAQVDDLVLVSYDGVFGDYDVSLLPARETS